MPALSNRSKADASIGVARVALLSAVAVAAMVLAIDVVTMGLSAAYVQANPDLARKWRHDSPSAMVGQANIRRSKGDAAGALKAARAAVVADPLSVAGLRTLGLFAASDGYADRADQIMSIAAKRSRRDVALQSWLIERRLAQGRYAEGVHHADALMRRAPTSSLTLVPMLAATVDDPSAASSLATSLAAMPPWRTRMLRELTMVSPLAAREVLVSLRSTASPPTAKEVQPYLGLLIGARQFAEAYSDWLILSPEADRGRPHDGGFRGTRAASPFNWSLPSSSGATSELTDAPDHPGSGSLLVSYDGFSAPPMPRQLLALPAGSYQLTGQAYAMIPEAHQRLRWRLSCADGGALLGTAGSAGAAGDWVDIETSFVVPREGCAAQWLALQPMAGERRANVQVWYRQLALHADE